MNDEQIDDQDPIAGIRNGVGIGALVWALIFLAIAL